MLLGLPPAASAEQTSLAALGAEESITSDDLNS
jgi:hypothetical protein